MTLLLTTVLALVTFGLFRPLFLIVLANVVVSFIGNDRCKLVALMSFVSHSRRTQQQCRPSKIHALLWAELLRSTKIILTPSSPVVVFRPCWVHLATPTTWMPPLRQLFCQVLRRWHRKDLLQNKLWKQVVSKLLYVQWYVPPVPHRIT